MCWMHYIWGERERESEKREWGTSPPLEPRSDSCKQFLTAKQTYDSGCRFCWPQGGEKKNHLMRKFSPILFGVVHQQDVVKMDATLTVVLVFTWRHWEDFFFFWMTSISPCCCHPPGKKPMNVSSRLGNSWCITFLFCLFNLMNGCFTCTAPCQRGGPNICISGGHFCSSWDAHNSTVALKWHREKKKSFSSSLSKKTFSSEQEKCLDLIKKMSFAASASFFTCVS